MRTHLVNTIIVNMRHGTNVDIFVQDSLIFGHHSIESSWQQVPLTPRLLSIQNMIAKLYGFNAWGMSNTTGGFRVCKRVQKIEPVTLQILRSSNFDMIFIAIMLYFSIKCSAISLLGNASSGPQKSGVNGKASGIAKQRQLSDT